MTEFFYYDDLSLARAWDGDVVSMIDALQEGFRRWRLGRVLLPEKASQIIDQVTQSRVNCMPATVFDEGTSGVKLVSVFPDNPKKGLPNVSGLMVLLDIKDGHPLAVLDAGFVTSLRTALVGGLAARWLAPEAPSSIALLGSGEQAKAHLLVMAALFPTLRECRVSSRTRKGADRLTVSLVGRIDGMRITSCGDDHGKAACGADIIITAISGQQPILKADWVKEGCFYCHVGGWEDEYAVVEKATKIVCDDWSALKHRGSPTLARMYNEGFLSDDEIYGSLADIVSNHLRGRESAEEIIYFNSIGLAFTDVIVARRLAEQCRNGGGGVRVSSRQGSLEMSQRLMEALSSRSTGAGI